MIYRSCVEIITMRRRITIHFEEKLKRRVLGLLLALAMRFCISESGVSFVESPRNFTLSLGKLVSLRCALRVDPDLDWDPDAVNPELEESFQDPQGPPELRWLRDGEILEDADTDHMQIPQEPSGWLVRSTLRIEEVQLSDMGGYQCMFYSGSEEMLSMEGFIQLEGLPVFSLEPQSLSVEVNQALSLHCEARGPPEPVHIIWLQDGAPLNSLDDPIALSPSTLRLPGLNRSSSFSCEAHNRKGVSSSTSGLVTVLPSPPSNIVAEEISNSSLQLSWVPGFGGEYPISLCSLQVRDTEEDLVWDEQVTALDSSTLVSNLLPFSEYDIRVSCRSSQGQSTWSQWVSISTSEGVPDSSPENLTVLLNGTEVMMSWAEPSGRINGRLQGYVMEYSTPNTHRVILDVGLDKELMINLSEPLSNISFRVFAYTSAGAGPWTLQQTVTLTQSETGLSRGSSPTGFSWHWWYVVMAVCVCVALAVLLAVYATRLRHKETRFGEAFEPMMERGELVVRYRARRTYSRRTTEATLNSLGVSDELKQKLQDVMVDRHRLTLGKTLGEGEFGSVMEGSLSQEDSMLKVAVKTMKMAICTRSEMEDFLREAACMKEFDHLNVMRLLGVCLQTVESEGFPSPVVILPYMKHGDLHSYLLYSRLGDSPVYLPSQMLVKFMTDISRGMEYLSGKHFIHRDLAARNCMLNENMTVCVADFGLSKKIYSGDYYRQGRISKMPVKWIALESLADRVYTSKSDVWSFGVTMWEIATRGQTPYPGVENSEIYDYLSQGNRLKQPPDCLDSIYSLMFSCWLLSPKDRPSFYNLRCELEKVLEELPSQDPEEILYVNMEEASGELGAVGGLEPTSGHLKGMGSQAGVTVEVHQSNRYVMCPQHESQRMLPRRGSTESVEFQGTTPDPLMIPPDQWPSQTLPRDSMDLPGPWDRPRSGQSWSPEEKRRWL